jgi:hypothetical protein
VQAAEIGLIGVEIRWSEPFAGNAAAGDRLEISGWRVDVDDFLVEQAGAEFGIPEVAERFFAGGEKGFIELAEEQRGLGVLDFEQGAAAGALGEEDLRDIVKRVNAGDLMDFLADEVNGFGIGDERDADAGGGSNFLALRRAVAAILEIAISAAALIGWATSAAALVATAIAIAETLLAVIAAGWTIVLSGIGSGRAGGLVRASRPGWAEGKLGQKATQGVGIGIAHSRKFS